MSEIGLIVDGEQYTAIFNDSLEMHTFTSDHAAFQELMDAISAQDKEGFIDNFSIANAISESLSVVTDSITIEDGAVYIDGVEVHSEVCDKIIQFHSEGLDYEFLVNFVRRLQKNPSKSSVDQLFKFLQHKGLAIGPDGRFWAYKTVASNYKDKYSGKFDNSVGCICSTPRNQVDDNPANHCSHGFHVGALEYAGPGGWYNSSGDHVMIVAVDPADAVSVPTDHSFQKLRVCKYEVIGEYKAELKATEDDVASIGGLDVSPEDLEVNDNVEISCGSEDFTGRVTFVDQDYLILIGQDGDDYFDEFELDFDYVSNIRYV